MARPCVLSAARVSYAYDTTYTISAAAPFTISGTATVSWTSVKVTGITVTGADNATTITTYGGTLQMFASVLPAEATEKTVTWSITSGSEAATINSTTGLLTAKANTDRNLLLARPCVLSAARVISGGNGNPVLAHGFLRRARIAESGGLPFPGNGNWIARLPGTGDVSVGKGSVPHIRRFASLPAPKRVFGVAQRRH